MKTTMLRIRLSATVISLLAPLAASADPGDGIGVGSWLLSPYIDINATYDSNVYKTRDNEIADTFFEPEFGLRMSSSTETNLLTLRGNAFMSRREYSSESSQDFSSWGDNLSLQYGRPEHFTIEGIQSFRHVQDYDRHASDMESSGLSESMVQDIHTLSAERNINQIGLGATRRLTDKTELTLGYRYCDVLYANDQFLDLDGQVGQIDAAYLMTDKTAAFLSLHGGIQNQEGTDGSATYAIARLGATTRGSDKMAYNAGAGIEHYTRPVASGNESFDTFNFNVTADWYVTEKVTLRCGGLNGTQLSSFYEGNGLNYVSGWAGAGYRWKPSTILSVRGIYRRDSYLDPVPDGNTTIDRADTRIEAHARIDYTAPANFLKLYFEASLDIADSNINTADYVDKRIMVGAELLY